MRHKYEGKNGLRNKPTTKNLLLVSTSKILFSLVKMLNKILNYLYIKIKNYLAHLWCKEQLSDPYISFLLT